MKLLLPMFAAGTIATSLGTPTLQKRQQAVVEAALAAISSATVNLDNAILAVSGADSAPAVLAASDNLASTLRTQTSNVAASRDLTEDEAFPLLTPVGALADIVNKTIDDLIGKKSIIVAACFGPTTLQTLQTQSSLAQTFADTTIAKVPEIFQPPAMDATQPILDSLAAGVAAFSDQTSLPPSCATTTSGTSTATTSTTSSGSQSVTTTSAPPPYSTSTYSPPPYSTYSPPPYSTYSPPPYTTYPTSTYKPTTYSSPPTGTYYPPGSSYYPPGTYTYSKPTTSYAVWTTTYTQPPPSGTYVVPPPSGGGSGTYVPQPPAGSPTTYAPQPPPGTTTYNAPPTTTSAPAVGTYTGAAAPKAANGMGAMVVAVIAGVAML